MTLDAKVVSLREELKEPGRFIVSIQNFSLKTLALLCMLKDEFPHRFVQDVWFKFGDDFHKDDYLRLCDVMLKSGPNPIRGKKFNVSIKKGQRLDYVLPIFKEIELLDCHEDQFVEDFS